MYVAYHKRFIKQFAKLPKEVQAQFERRLDIFYEDTFNPLLHNHSLVGKYQGHRSINVNADIRAVFKEVEEDHCMFTAIGSHSELYE